MAEGEDVGWWRSWLQQSYQAVKEKSSEALEFMKRDLTEFSQVVQHDTACTIAATASVVKEKLAIMSYLWVTCLLSGFSLQTEGSSGATEKMKKGLSDFLGVISDTFAPSADKTIECDVITLMGTPSGTAEPYDGTKARLYSLQSDPATYCNEPDGPPELFDAWLSQFCLEEKKGQISELIAGSPSIRALYTKMVPAAVSHSEFWHRYFYKVHQLEQEQARRDALKQRAEQTISEEAGWEEDEEELVGISPTSPKEAKVPVTSTSTSPEGRTGPQSPSEENLVTPVETPAEVTPSESSESISLVTQIAKPATSPEAPMLPRDLSQKLQEASLEEQDLAVDVGETGPPPPAHTKPLTPAGRPSGSEPRPPARVETLREEVPTDLRVFELNSDSGKSTPSNNGKKGSSTDISEDWEKDFDLDMTEEEVQMALSKVDASGELEDAEWEDWE
ncbi:PREDICTED: BSD domain-containing protein 1 isoform X1 [Elephantulus edwardii]|uniref:BSD domain-containing protein 1 isoform X1 n=1 Tax=Elephantulus edwardii TaxID=28737 RepID=UPI0003F095BD|nr:PREDICTED: BSD domain-containing protein 1 isoform X1 [Elephantulus edwardii]